MDSNPTYLLHKFLSVGYGMLAANYLNLMNFSPEKKKMFWQVICYLNVLEDRNMHYFWDRNTCYVGMHLTGQTPT